MAAAWPRSRLCDVSIMFGYSQLTTMALMINLEHLQPQGKIKA